MRGYTRFTQEHGDEAASARAGRFADFVRATVPENEGERLELRRDEALSAFRWARQALRRPSSSSGTSRCRRVRSRAFLIGVVITPRLDPPCDSCGRGCRGSRRDQAEGRSCGVPAGESSVQAVDRAVCDVDVVQVVPGPTFEVNWAGGPADD